MNLYKHSGKVGYSPILFLVAGIPAIIILSLIYAYITVYNPIAGYLTIIILIGYVVILGFIISFLAGVGKCRSKPFLILIGLATGLLSLYFSWVFFLYALSQNAGFTEVGVLDIILSPSAMLSAILSLNESGWYSIKSFTPTGMVSWVFWGIEALIIVLGSLFMTVFSIDDEMFCENCNAWCDVSETNHFKVPKELGATKAADINPLKLPTLEAADSNILRPIISRELLKCESCNDYSGWRYKLIDSVIDDEGNEKDKEETISGIVLGS